MNNKNSNSDDSPTGEVLKAYIGPFMAELRAAGYAAHTLCTKRVTLKQFLRWRHQRKSRSWDVTEQQIREFLTKSIEGDRSRRSIATRAPEHPEFGTALEARYADFLRNEKGLAELSLKVYLPVAKDLLHYLEKEHHITAVRHLDASILRAYLLGHAKGRSSECVRLLATSLRSFLRFLHAQGEIRNDLTAAIPTVRQWTQPGIPRTLAPAEVNRTLDAPDRATATGRRDYAM